MLGLPLLLTGLVSNQYLSQAASLDCDPSQSPSQPAIAAMKLSHLQSFLAFTPAVLGDWPEAKGKAIQYSSVPGYFLQDDPATDASKFDYASSH